MKPNILQLIGSFHQGGTERQVVQLTKLLVESDRYHVHIACLDGSGVLRSEVESLGFDKIPEFPLTSFYDRNFIRQLRRFARFLREREISLLHTHDFYGNVFGMVGATISRLPIVRIASRRETGGVRTAAQDFVLRRAYSRAHAIVANAEAVRSELIANGLSPDKVTTIYNGLELARVAPPVDLKKDTSLSLLGLQNTLGKSIVTIVANMRHVVKDHKTFLRAAQRVRKQTPSVAFVIAGEGELMESLRQFVSNLGLSEDVYFIGQCTNVAELLAVSDVCVLSSTNEGFSNSILEYMAASKPVVVTDVGGAREAVADGESGYIVSVGNDESMAERIASLLEHPDEAKKMGEAGRRIVKEKFSCEAQLTNTLTLYDRLMSGSEAKDAHRASRAANQEATVIER